MVPSESEKAGRAEVMQKGATNAALLWHIRGKNYDLRPFLARHPGGKLILQQTQGPEDSTPLFESYHALSDMDRIERMMRKYEVTTKTSAENSAAAPVVGGDAPAPIYSFAKDGLYNRIRDRVREMFGKDVLQKKEYKAGPILVLTALVTIGAWLASFYYAFVAHGSPLFIPSSSSSLTTTTIIQEERTSVPLIRTKTNREQRQKKICESNGVLCFTFHRSRVRMMEAEGRPFSDRTKQKSFFFPFFFLFISCTRKLSFLHLLRN